MENNKCSIKARDIYLELNEFKKKCDELNVQISDRLLETYEKHELICPLYRIRRPKEYLKTIFDQYQGSGRFKNIIEVPVEYKDLFDFEDKELDRWDHPIFPGFDKALSEGHPLDQAYNKGEAFIEIPSKDTYSNWKEYNVVLETTIEETSIKDTKSTARHFYSPWQIYLLEEANRKHTRKINVLIELKEGEKYILHEEPYRLTLVEWQKHFKSLWEFRFKENLLFAKALEKVKGNILEGADLKLFNDDRKKFATNICSYYSYESWIKFLQALCILYFNYQDNEKLKLSNCLKSDIRSVIDLLMLALEKNYSNIIKDVGMNLSRKSYLYATPLERIYPEYESFLKREVKLSFESILKDYNNEVPNILVLNKQAIDEIIDYAFNSGNETLLVSIIGINKEYFSPSYFGNEGIWSYIRSLATAVESWTKTISGITLTGKNDFIIALNQLSNNDFDSCYNKLPNKCKNIITVSDLNYCLRILTTIRFSRNRRDLTWMKYILRAYLIRNYVAHHTKLEPELFGNTLIELYRSLLFLVFYSWKTK